MDSIFSKIVKSRLPLVVATTDDAIYAVDMIEYWAGKGLTVNCHEGISAEQVSESAEATLNLTFEIVGDVQDVYLAAEEHGNTVLWINPEDDADTSLAVDAGAIPVPVEMVRGIFKDVAPNKHVTAFTNAVSGMSLKQVHEAVALSVGLTGKLSSSGLTKARRLLSNPVQGIELVDTDYGFYAARQELADWVNFEGKFLKGNHPSLFWPRGLIFHGIPGTGKTLGAKYVAHELGLPLYRLDLGHVMSRWQGESEQRIRTALHKAEGEAPCVLLLDEIEKVLGKGDDDVMHRLLGYLLWWLQEHQSKVVTIMTTNDLKVLPKEIYRAGRIDRAVEFEGLQFDEAIQFCEMVYEHYCEVLDIEEDPDTLENARQELKDVGYITTHAAIDKMVLNQIKHAL